MNAKKSWIVFILYGILLIGFIWGSIRGINMLEENLGKGLGWLLGSIFVFCTGIFLSYKLKKRG